MRPESSRWLFGPWTQDFELNLFVLGLIAQKSSSPEKSRSVPVVPESLVVVARTLLGNKFVFELADLFRGEDRGLGARHHSPGAYGWAP